MKRTTTMRFAKPGDGRVTLRVKTPAAAGDPLACANGRPVRDFYKTPLGIPYEEPKTCLGCGAKFTTIPDGGLPCGH